MQPHLAPAPPPSQTPPHQLSATENDLRAQLALAITPDSPSYTDGLPALSSSADAQHSMHHIESPLTSIAADATMQDMLSASAGDSGGDDDPRKGAKRELSQSKRAAQNRAAQRAFRQRKEGYIKKLEEQVRSMNQTEEAFKAIQAENYSLREYIIHLQSRLIEAHGDYPQPPANITLTPPASNPSSTTQQDISRTLPPPVQQSQPPPSYGRQDEPIPSLEPIAAALAAEDNLEERAMSQLQASTAQAIAREAAKAADNHLATAENHDTVSVSES